MCPAFGLACYNSRSEGDQEHLLKKSQRKIGENLVNCLYHLRGCHCCALLHEHHTRLRETRKTCRDARPITCAPMANSMLHIVGQFRCLQVYIVCGNRQEVLDHSSSVTWLQVVGWHCGCPPALQSQAISSSVNAVQTAAASLSALGGQHTS